VHYGSAEDACNSRGDIQSFLVNGNYLVIESEVICAIYRSNGAFYITRVVQKVEEDVYQCDQLDYPNEEDVDGDGNPDHCHISECRNRPLDGSDMFAASGSQTNALVCVEHENGEYCEYQRQVVEDPNNIHFGFDIFGQTGESCGGDVNDLTAPPYVPQDEDELPDPSDPNSPPAENGDPDCTPVDGTGLNICSADPLDVCDSSSGVEICPSGCGMVNGGFVCIEDDAGNRADTELPENDNDNSDNQEADDPNTQGDEGAHSRLDGLLENTDGIEGLLRGIKDAIGDIPGGGGDSSAGEPVEEEEPNCPAGQFYIGENCITFDKNDQPINSDLDFTEINQKVDEKETELTNLINTIKDSISNKFSLNLTGGAYDVRVETIKGATVDFGFARLSNLFNFSLWGSIIMLVAGIRSIFIMMGD